MHHPAEELYVMETVVLAKILVNTFIAMRDAKYKLYSSAENMVHDLNVLRMESKRLDVRMPTLHPWMSDFAAQTLALLGTDHRNEGVMK